MAPMWSDEQYVRRTGPFSSSGTGVLRYLSIQVSRRNNFRVKTLLNFISTERYALMENRKLSGLIFDLEKNWNTLSKIRDGVEAQLNHGMRKKIATEARLAKEMRQGLTDEFIKAALERSAAQIEREKAEEERLKAESDREAAQKDRELAEAERRNAAQERMAAEEERKEAQLHRITDLTWKCAQNQFQAGIFYILQFSS
jgi:hypothetical protein